MPFNYLVVDDSTIVRTVIVKTLKLCNADIGQIFEAADGSQALEILGGNRVDLVFADINMPVMDGVEMIRSMRQNGLLAAIPVVIISTEGSQKRISSLMDAGVKDFLRKPFTPEQIRAVIDAHLGGGRHVPA